MAKDKRMSMKKNYYKFLIGRFISSFGNWFVEMALPFVIFHITGSAMAVSVSFLLETLPIILLAPVTSYMVDNHARKNILLCCELVSAAAILLCILTNCSNIYVLYLACSILAVCGNIYTITVNAYIPDICGNLDLELANTIDAYAGNIAMITAPVLAGWCIKLFGNRVSFAIDMFSFILSALCIASLTSDKQRLEKLKEQPDFKRKAKEIMQIKEWKALLKNNVPLRKIVAVCIMFSACGAIFSSLDAVYVAEIFQDSTDVYGYINSAWGVGMIVTGALYVIYKRFSDIKVFSFGIFCMGIATIGYGLSNNIPICILFNFIGGLANTLYVIYFRSLLQSRAQANERGKVFTMQSTLSKICSIFIVSMAGILADIMSVRYVIVFSGIMTIVIAFASMITLEKN